MECFAGQGEEALLVIFNQGQVPLSVFRGLTDLTSIFGNPLNNLTFHSPSLSFKHMESFEQQGEEIHNSRENFIKHRLD